MDYITLDEIDNLKAPADSFDRPKNAFWESRCQCTGLKALFKSVERWEGVLSQKFPQDQVVAFYLSAPEFEEIPMDFITCAFHWYAIAACQFVGLIHFVGEPPDHASKSLSRDYTNRVIPEIKIFRDKIAAHYAGATFNKADNQADRFASLIPKLSYRTPHFYMGDLRTTIVRPKSAADEQPDSVTTEIQSWSLVEQHKRLMERYPLLR